MKKFSIPFLILITFCSSGAENTEPQDTSNNEQSQEIELLREKLKESYCN